MPKGIYERGLRGPQKRKVPTTVLTYTVQKLGEGSVWLYLTEKNTWSADILEAKTWDRPVYADKVSFKHLGAVVRGHVV